MKRTVVTPLSRTSVRQFIEGPDRVIVGECEGYEPRTADRARLWSRIRSAAAVGATYSALRALCQGHPEYIDFLIGTARALRCTALEERIGMTSDAERHDDLDLEPWDWESPPGEPDGSI